MKIAQLAPIWYSIPPKKYGGTEEIISLLTDGLVKNRHDVTLFATKDSKTTAKLVSFFDNGIVGNIFPSTREFFLPPLIHMVKSLEIAKKSNFDIIHCHFTTLSDFILLGLIKDYPNCLFTSHSLFPGPDAHLYRYNTFNLFNDVPFVSISNNQRKGMKLNFVATVYHGIKINSFVYNDDVDRGNKDYMFWISRISPLKGIVDAIEVSIKTGKKLYFTAIVNTKEDKEYYEKNVVSFIGNPQIIPLPELDFDKKMKYYRMAKLLIFPVHWEEPFGLVIPEAMACGTPVIGYARGSLPELIKDGKTGFLVNSSEKDIRGNFITKKTGIEGLCEAVETIYALSDNRYKQMRKACRSHAEKYFSADRMVKEYEKVYQKILRLKTPVKTE